MNAQHLEWVSQDTAGLADHLAAIAELRARLNSLEATVLRDMARPGAALFPRVWVDRLAELVAFEYGIEVTDLRGSHRNSRFTRPRFLWVWLVWKISRESYPRVATLTNYVEHSAVIHACRRVVGWRKSNADFALVTEQLLLIGRSLRTPSVELAEPGEPEAEPGQ